MLYHSTRHKESVWECWSVNTPNATGFIIQTSLATQQSPSPCHPAHQAPLPRTNHIEPTTLILVTASSTMCFLRRLRRLRPPSSSTSTEPKKCSLNTVPASPPVPPTLPPGGSSSSSSSSPLGGGGDDSMGQPAGHPATWWLLPPIIAMAPGSWNLPHARTCPEAANWQPQRMGLDKCHNGKYVGWDGTPLYQILRRVCWKSPSTSKWWPSTRAAVRGGSSVRAAALPQILRKIKLNIWMKVFFRKYVHSLKAYEWNHFKFKYSRQTLSAAESKWAVPCPDVGRWVSTARPSGGKTVADRSQARLQALQPRQGSKDGFVYLFTFSNTSNAEILITIFKISINKNSVKYLQGINFGN